MAAKKQVGATSNEFIKNILNNNAPLTSTKIDQMLAGNQDNQEHPQDQLKAQMPELKLSSFVIEMEFLPKVNMKS